MRRKSFEDMRCSVAQALEVVGEWWTLLIIRDLLMGVARFDDLQGRLGIARNVLTDRLATLVDAGILERRAYQQNPERYDYRLTEKGADLWIAVNALREWGDRWAAPDGPPVELHHRDCGGEVHLHAVCDDCGERVTDRRQLQMRLGPGAGPSPILPADRRA